MGSEIIDVTNQLMWTPWIVLGTKIDGNKLVAGQAIRVGSHMTKNGAWDAARTEQEKRPGTIAIAVRRDNEQF